MIAIKPAPSSTGIVNTSISVSAYELASEDSAMGVNEYWDRYKGTLETTFGEFELTKESELTVDGIPAARKEYKGKLTDSVYKFVQVFCIRNGTVYQITFTASEEDYDSYVSAVDTVTAKLAIIEKAKREGVPVISAMGAGNKLNPELFRVADISETSVCPLARVMRRELKKRDIRGVKVVYSREDPLPPLSGAVSEAGKPVPGSVAFVPSVAGLILAGEVVKDIARKDIAGNTG